MKAMGQGVPPAQIMEKASFSAMSRVRLCRKAFTFVINASEQIITCYLLGVGVGL